jgi:hypothetical protein
VEIQWLMLRSTEEAVNKDNLYRGKFARASRKMQKQQQKLSRGEEGQLHKKVWDPGGFQQSWEAHEQELMNFPLISYFF